MTRLTALLCASSLTLLSLLGCGSGRAPVPPGTIPQALYVTAEDEAYGHQVLAELSRSYPLSRDDASIERVRTLVTRLAKAAHADSNPWNVFVLEGDDVVNAAATRGHYVFVWTGMLRTAQSDGELATVIAHELGHVLANHTKPTPQEEASKIMARTTGEIAGQIVASQPGYAPLAQITGVLVTELIKAIAVNPETQRLETEADHIGFFLMADAGFDPHDALSLWSKMADSPGSAGEPLQFLSSHPTSSDRLDALHALLPEALARYRNATAPPTSWRPKRTSGGVNQAPRSDIAKTPQPPAPTSNNSSDDSFAIE
jgi:predicted Zn-dependent protease